MYTFRKVENGEYEVIRAGQVVGLIIPCHLYSNTDEFFLPNQAYGKLTRSAAIQVWKDWDAHEAAG